MMGFQDVEKLSTGQQCSPITNLKHPYALSVSDDVVVRTPLTPGAREGLASASAECKRMFQIGDRQTRSADFRNWIRQVCFPQPGIFGSRFASNSLDGPLMKKRIAQKPLPESGVKNRKPKHSPITPTFDDVYWKQWKPDVDHVNSLPVRVRDFIRDLQHASDSHGEILALHLLKDENEALRALIEKQLQKIQRLERHKT
jgi:hypothetical protein